MSLKEHGYSVLVVSAAEKFNAACSVLLPEAKYAPVQIVLSVNAAKRAFAERDFDFVIVNAPLPDDTGVRFAMDAGMAKGTAVLLLIRAEVYSEIYDRVTENGIFTLPKPLSRSSLSMGLCWLAAARERLRRFEKKTLSIEEKMAEIRLVNRAKWLLISELKMDEPYAHHYIEKQAMDRCISKREIAEEIIKMYS